MKKLVCTLGILSTTLLAGCSTLSSSNGDNQIKYCANDKGEFYPCKNIVIEKNIITEAEPDSTLYAAPLNFVFLNEYTEQLAYELKRSLNNKKLNGNIAVTNFVFLDNSLKRTDAVGRQIAELLSSDLQNNNLPVSELNLTRYIDINEQGEFSLSQSFEELNAKVKIDYICTGTLIENPQGLLINAKIINRKNNKIVASANSTLPRMLLDKARKNTSF